MRHCSCELLYLQMPLFAYFMLLTIIDRENNSLLSGSESIFQYWSFGQFNVFTHKSQVINWGFETAGIRKPREKNLLHFAIILQITCCYTCKARQILIYCVNLSIRDFKSFGSIVVFPRINQHLCIRSAKYCRVACKHTRENKYELRRLWCCIVQLSSLF